MKTSVIVTFYSVVLIVLFGVSCYLMSSVNPDPLPEEVRRRISVDNMYPKDVPPNDNIYYGLEKIPEDVDADEFRRQLMTTVTKYKINMDQILYESTQKVVPPIWPNEQRANIERNTNKQNIESKLKNSTNAKTLFETSSPVKGLRRSVSNDTPHEQDENLGSVLLKIINDNGQKKIEIKFLSRAKVKTKKQNRGINKSKSNETINELANCNQSDILNVTEDAKGKVIQIKADDVILLTIDHDSDVVVGDSGKSEIKATEEAPKLIINISGTSFNFNQTLNNGTDISELHSEKEQVMIKEMYTVN